MFDRKIDRRHGWERGASGEVKLKGRTYKDLTEFKRPCATCGNYFSIFVTAKIAEGRADSNSFGLRNCEEHRRLPVPKADSPELEQLRMENRTMKEELDGLYKRDAEHFAEIQQLKARLSKYELTPALQAAGDLTKFPWAL